MAKQVEVTLAGKKYLLQHPGVRWYIQISDKHKTRNGVNQEGYISDILEHVVVNPPNLTIDDFETVSELETLVAEVEKVLRGK